MARGEGRSVAEEDDGEGGWLGKAGEYLRNLFDLQFNRLAVHASRMAGHTEDIAGGLPRITFWKTGRRKDGDEL